MKIISILIGLLLATCASEVFVRLFLPQIRYPHPRGLYTADADTGYRNAPGFTARWRTDVSDVDVRINALGFRGPEPRAEDATARRILILGDSFTFGPEVAYDATFSAQLQRRLTIAGSDTHWHVHNAGVNGYGTRQQAALLRSVGPRVQPHIVVVAFYNNDIKDSVREPRSVAEGYLVDAGGAVDPGARWYSHAWALLERRVQSIIDKYVKPASVLAVYRKEYTEKMGRAWELTRTAFGEIFQWCRQQQVPVVVMVINNGRQINPARFHDFRIDDAAYDFQKPNRLVAELCADAQVPVLDLWRAFRDAGSPEALYYHGAGHFTPAGHAVAATALAEFLWAHGVGGGE